LLPTFDAGLKTLQGRLLPYLSSSLLVPPCVPAGLKTREYREHPGAAELKKLRRRRHRWVYIIRGYNPSTDPWFVARLVYIHDEHHGVQVKYENKFELDVSYPLIGIEFNTRVAQANIPAKIPAHPVGLWCLKHGRLVGSKGCRCSRGEAKKGNMGEARRRAAVGGRKKKGGNGRLEGRQREVRRARNGI